MKYLAFLASWQGVQRENYWHRTLLFGLVASNGALILALFTQSPVVVLTPPVPGKAFTLSDRHADNAYLESWGLYLSQLLGNVTPDNVALIREALGPLLAPSVYHQAMQVLEQQRLQIEQDRVSLSFSPKTVSWHPDSKRVYVTGHAYTRSAGQKPVRQVRTWAFDIEIINYQPVIHWLTTYEGDPDNAEESRP